MGDDNVSQVVKLALVVLVVAVVVIGAIFFFSPIRSFFLNLFSYNNTGIQSIAGGWDIEAGNVPASCYEQYPECRICAIYWATDKDGNYNKDKERNYLPEIKLGEETYLFVGGTAGCKGKGFFKVWKDNWLKDELVFEKLVDFSGDKVYTAYAKFKPSEKGQYYFQIFDENEKNLFFKVSTKMLGEEAKQEAKSDNLVVK